MKKIFSLTLTLTLLVALTAMSSSAFAGIVDVRFANEQITADNYCVTVQIKAQDIAFEIGSATVFFNYNTAAINNPTHTSLNFSEGNLCALGGTTSVYKNSFTKLEAGAAGEGNYSILLTTPNEGCPTVNSSEWVDVANFCFDVVDAATAPDLSIVTQYTAFNTVDNGGDQHDLGSVEGVVSSVTSPSGADANIAIFPNYTQNQVSVEYFVKGAGNVSINVYDMLGRVLQSNDANVPAGKHRAEIDFSKFGNGYYLVEIDNGTEKVSEKVLLAK